MTGENKQTLVLMALFGIPTAILTEYLVASILLVVLWTAVAVLMIAENRHVLRPSREELQRADRELEYTRFCALSHLTPLDERELAERHFWSPPREVSRIRSGMPFDQEWKYGSIANPPPAIRDRIDLERRAKKARAEFYGENRGSY